MAEITTLDLSTAGNNLIGFGANVFFDQVCITKEKSSQNCEEFTVGNETIFMTLNGDVYVQTTDSGPRDTTYRDEYNKLQTGTFGGQWHSTGWHTISENPTRSVNLIFEKIEELFNALPLYIRTDATATPIEVELLSLNAIDSDDYDDDPNITAALTNWKFVLGQGIGLFNSTTSSGDQLLTGNLNNFSPNRGYWFQIDRPMYIHLKNTTLVDEEDDGLNIEIKKTAVKSINGYENNLFSFIRTNQSNLPLNDMEGFLYTDCNAITGSNIPVGTILYSNYNPSEDVDMSFYNTSAYYSNEGWVSSNNEDFLKINQAYNIQFPLVTDNSGTQSFKGCFAFDEPRLGCTNPNAENYDENAFFDDGSCVTETETQVEN